MRKIAYLVFGAVLLSGSLWVAKADNVVKTTTPVSPAAISIVAETGLTGTVNQYFNARFVIKGGVAPYTFNFSGNIPAGTYVSLACNGYGYGYGCPPYSATEINVSGYPYIAGISTATFTVYDRYGRSGSGTFTFNITDPGKVVVTSPNGGEAWTRNSLQQVRWSATANQTFTVYAVQQDPKCYGYACGPVWYTIAYNVSGNGFNWTVGTDAWKGKLPDGQYKIAVYSDSSYHGDLSDGSFRIVSR